MHVHPLNRHSVSVGAANGAEVNADADGCRRASLDVDGVVAVAAEERLGSRQKTMAAIARVFPEEDEAPRASPIVASVHDGGRRLAISFLIGWMRPR